MHYVQPFAHIMENHVLSVSDDGSKVEAEPNRQDDNGNEQPMFKNHHHRTIVNDSVIMRSYLVSTARENLKDLIYGNLLSDKKGCSHWQKLVSQYHEHVNIVVEKHAAKLGEQRDFWSFVLTIWQVITFPITTMTGYWYEFS